MRQRSDRRRETVPQPDLAGRDGDAVSEVGHIAGSLGRGGVVAAADSLVHGLFGLCHVPIELYRYQIYGTLTFE